MPSVERTKLLLWTVALLLVSACDNSSCVTGQTSPALVLTIVDKATRENLASLAQIAVRRLTPFQDSASGRFAGPTDIIGSIINLPPGRFEVRVDVPGYTPWQRELDFSEGECGELAPQRISAEMTR